MKDSLSALGVMALVLLCAVVGCGGRGRPNQVEEASTLKPLARFYGDYINQHQGNPPAGEAEFKAFLQEKKIADILKEEFKITDVNKVLISSRDNKPYVIYYGTMSKNQGPGGAPVVAYEQVGSEGKRFVVSALGAVVEVDEAAFRKMVPDAK